ncbi:MAG: YitT family protein, partial [Ureaplasma sp.]|nr:YitT family protein [Ureaplasma sp.]
VEQLEKLQAEYNLINNSDDKEKENKLSLLEQEIDLKKAQLKQTNNLSEINIKTQNIKYSAKTIRFGWLYKIDKLWMKILLVCLLGTVVSITTWLFVQYTGVYTPGISGIIQGIAKIIRIQISNTGNTTTANIVYNVIFWGLYVLINIPLIIFAYYKIGKKFAILTLFFIISSQLVGFALGFINHGNGIFILTNMNNSAGTENIPGYIAGAQMLPWESTNGMVFGLFIYALIASITSGIIYSMIYILGSSTGGTDIIGFYYSKIKNKSIANLLTIFNVASLTIGVTLGSFTCWILEYQRLYNEIKTGLAIEAFFSPNLISSIIGSVISGLLYNYYFPRNKVVKVQIYSEKINEIAISLKSSEWNYKIAINSSDNSTLNNESLSSYRSLETICFYIDIQILISIMRSIDTQGLITIYSTFGFDGELPTSTYER